MINAVLVRWSKGWYEVTDAASIAAHGRHEALLGLGAVESVEELVRIAGRQLDVYGTVREEIAGDLAPVGAADTPYIAFEVGDTIGVPASDGTPSQERVTALTVAEDENGQLTWVPELRDVLLTQAERLEQGLKKMADGTLGGESRVATPTGQITTQAPIVKAATSVQPPVAEPTQAWWSGHGGQAVSTSTATPVFNTLNSGGLDWNYLSGPGHGGGVTTADGVIIAHTGIYEIHMAATWFEAAQTYDTLGTLDLIIDGVGTGGLSMQSVAHVAWSRMLQINAGSVVKMGFSKLGGSPNVTLSFAFTGSLYTTNTGLGLEAP